MSKIKSYSTRFLCLALGAMMALAAFFIGYDTSSLLRTVVFGFMSLAAATYLLSSVFGTDLWRSRLIGFAPWA
jgi:hypothetical protein